MRAQPEGRRQSRAALRQPPPGEGSPSAQNDSAGVGLLPPAAAARDDNKVLDMYAAALEIDCVAAEPAHAAIAEQITQQWPKIHAHDPRTLEEGKLGLVRRFGEGSTDDRFPAA